MHELAHQNSLLKTYIASLEKQIQANSQERKALSLEIAHISAHDQPHRRISPPPQHSPQEVLLLQQKVAQQMRINSALTEEIRKVREELKQAANSQAQKQRRIQELTEENRVIVTQKKEILQLKASLAKKEELVSNWQAKITEKEKMEKMYEVALKELEKEKGQKRRISQQNEQHAIKIKHLTSGLEQQKEILGYLDALKKTRLELQAKVFTYEAEQSKFHAEIAQQKAIIIQLQRQNDEYRRRLQDSQSLLACAKDENTKKEGKWAGEKAQLQQKIANLQQDRINLLSENESISSTLQSTKQEVEQLTSEIKQFVTCKMQGKSKTRTDSACKTQYEFTSAFKQLKIQIQAIKQPQPQTPSHSRHNSKQNIPFEPSSPSQWKSIEGKLSILRSTQSMSRFK